VAQNHKEQVLARLKSIEGHVRGVARMVEELNFSFHRTINSVVEAPRLKWFLRATTRHVPRGYYTTVPGWPQATLQDHGAIIDALAAHDGVTAGRLMEAHVVRGGNLAAEQRRGVGQDR